MRPILLLIFLSGFLPACGQELTWKPWQEGYLDIHHISTGSGNATFMVFPDGTTLLFDAGEVDRVARTRTPNPLKASPPLPADTVTAGQSIINYIRFFHSQIKQLDYGVVSHFHSDHYGSLKPGQRLSRLGNYRLTGITEVHESIPFVHLLDRGYPDYNYPVDLRSKVLDKEVFANYLTFVNSQVQAGKLKASSLRAGSTNQIRTIIHPNKYPAFMVRNIKSSHSLWTGKDTLSVRIIPEAILEKDYNENPLSLALEITYGSFNYFTGGDMTGLRGFGLPSWFDTETPTAAVVGPVDVLSINHHGVRDASNLEFLHLLAPRVLVQQSWSSNHPGEEVLHRMIAPSTYSGPRDIFATYIHPETVTTYGRWLNDNYRSQRGHIVVRVYPGGSQYEVWVMDDSRYSEQAVLRTPIYTSR
ncbi:MAG TPA: MBL fold metallo-hydrolase [Cyclobacteriaceae bacterium]|nr:MBL fold metallo-hydrolase [Cyclobacteriaceae bacterium]